MEWGLWPVHHVFSVSLSSSGWGGLLILSLTPEQEPSHSRQSIINFSSISPSHKLQFSKNCSSVGPSHEEISLEWAAPVWVSCKVTCPANKASPGWALVCSYEVTGSTRILLQHVLPMGSQLPLGIHLLLHGVLQDSVPQPSPHLLSCGPPWAAGAQVFHHGLHYGLWGNFSSGTSSTSFPYLCTNLQSCSLIS